MKSWTSLSYSSSYSGFGCSESICEDLDFRVSIVLLDYIENIGSSFIVKDVLNYVFLGFVWKGLL
jgi:hypothetical protein